MGTQLSPAQKGAQQPPPVFLAHVHCGQMVSHLGNCWAFVVFILLQSVLSVCCVVDRLCEDDVRKCWPRSRAGMTECWLSLLTSLATKFTCCITWHERHSATLHVTRNFKPLWILMKQEMFGWHLHELDHMHIVCTPLQTGDQASTSSLNFCRPEAIPDA